MRSVVVLPQPDGPRSEKNSPGGISRLRPSTAAKSPKRFTRSISCTAPPAMVGESIESSPSEVSGGNQTCAADQRSAMMPSVESPGARTADDVSVRRRIAPLLAGYWAFGQYWGVWVILVFEYQRDHAISDSRIGVLYTALSVVAVGVMLVVAPRMARFRLGSSVPLSLGSLGLAAIAIALFPDSLVLLAFVLIGVGNGLIDVY